MEQKEVYEKFIKGSIITTLLLGGPLGVMILLSIFLQVEGAAVFSQKLLQLHAHFQLFGWLGLFIMGIAYHVIPRFKASQIPSKNLADLSFLLVAGGLVVRGLQLFLPEESQLAAFSAVLQTLGAITFTYVIYRTVQASEQPREPFEGFVYAALIWYTVGSILNLASTLSPASGMREAFIHSMLLGFATNMIMAVGVRTMPVFLGLRQAEEKHINYILVSYNAAVILRVAALAMGLSALLQLTVVLEAIALIAFIYTLNIFAKPEIDLPPMEASKNLERSVKGAYIWLIAALMIDLYNNFLGGGFYIRGAYLHAVTVGFISMMIFGYATRIIPIFRGVDLHSLKLADTALYLLIGGNILRVVLELFQPLTASLNPILGLSGAITLAAYAVFSYNIWLTMVKPYEED